MIQHLDTLALLAVIVDTERRQNKTKDINELEYSIRKLCDIAFNVESQIQDVLFDIDDFSLEHINKGSKNAICINGNVLIVQDIHSQTMKGLIKGYKPSKDIEKQIKLSLREIS